MIEFKSYIDQNGGFQFVCTEMDDDDGQLMANLAILDRLSRLLGVWNIRPFGEVDEREIPNVSPLLVLSLCASKVAGIEIEGTSLHLNGLRRPPDVGAASDLVGRIADGGSFGSGDHLQEVQVVVRMPAREV